MRVDPVVTDQLKKIRELIRAVNAIEDSGGSGPGEPGLTPQLRFTAGVGLEYRYGEDEDWQLLTPVAAITGPPGNPGAAGSPGLDGEDGLTPMLQFTPEVGIELRYAAEDPWTLLVPVADITGPQGPSGEDSTGGGGGGIRQIITYDTIPLDPGAFAQGLIAVGRTAAILRVAVDTPCRIRLYATPEQRVLDLLRDEITPAPLSVGLILDLVFDTPGQVITTPTAIGADMRVDPGGHFACTVTNKGSVQQPIAVTFTSVSLEA